MENLIKKIYRYRAKRSLISKYLYLNEVDRLMEEFQTSKILQGGTEEQIQKGRNALSEIHMRMRGQTELINFLKNI